MSLRFASLGLILASTLACGVEPLRGEQLYGPLADDARDASADVLVIDAAEVPAPDVAPPDKTPDKTSDTDIDPACDYSNLNGSVSGWFVDACNGAVLDSAQVGLGGKHTCAWQGKGSFDISMLPVGCDKTLTTARAGFKPYTATIHLQRNGNPSIEIRLEREQPCDPQVPSPPAPKCVCADAACTQPP
jgi:hypothetical protein